MKTHAGRKLSRPTGARHALLRQMTESLLQHERVVTTVAKAREVSRYAEGVMAKAKSGNLVARRAVKAVIKGENVYRKIYDVLVPRYQNRAGGCTQVFRLGRRAGDGAEMAVLKLIS